MIFNDDNGLPSINLITPFTVLIEGETGIVVDFSPFVSQLSGLNEAFHIGFTLDIQDTIYIHGFDPSMHSHTSTLDGTNWSLIDKDHFFCAIIGEFIPVGYRRRKICITQ